MMSGHLGIQVSMVGASGGQERAWQWGGACQAVSLLVPGLGHPTRRKARETIFIRVLL